MWKQIDKNSAIIQFHCRRANKLNTDPKISNEKQVF